MEAAKENEKQTDRRQRAASESSNVVDLEAQRKKTEALYKAARDQAEAAAALELQRKSLNAQIKAIYDEVEALGFDRKAFKDMTKLKAKSDEERQKYEASRRQLANAFGFESGEQLDAFDPTVPDPDQPELGENVQH